MIQFSSSFQESKLAKDVLDVIEQIRIKNLDTKSSNEYYGSLKQVYR